MAETLGAGTGATCTITGIGTMYIQSINRQAATIEALEFPHLGSGGSNLKKRPTDITDLASVTLSLFLNTANIIEQSSTIVTITITLPVLDDGGSPTPTTGAVITGTGWISSAGGAEVPTAEAMTQEIEFTFDGETYSVTNQS